MEIQARATTRLRYRFADVKQAQAHVRKIEEHTLFFYRDDKLRLLPYAPVCLEWTFDESGGPSRLLHGWVVGSLEGSGTWIELLDTRPLRDPIPDCRRSPRMGCDVLVEVRGGGRIETGRMLDLSAGGARIGGIAGMPRREHVEIRMLSPDRLTFHDLSFGYVAWTEGSELGVQFDQLDLIGRSAVSRLVAETEVHWTRAWESCHPGFCCNGKGVIEPEPPRLRSKDEITGKIAL
ncbi:MAG: PilZ domain-containing protein [Myxococcales bacterium]|nr:PilZ domain-containing protein [Myxococcales bacterium]